ncbi:outer membrane porin, OprD family [Pseudomonas sp. CM25]|nr:outer membrane porin, OprD family [Pseudomonas sp. CM25]
MYVRQSILLGWGKRVPVRLIFAELVGSLSSCDRLPQACLHGVFAKPLSIPFRHNCKAARPSTVQSESFRDLTVRWRNDTLRRDFSNNEYDENRIIITYPLDLL